MEVVRFTITSSVPKLKYSESSKKRKKPESETKKVPSLKKFKHPAEYVEVVKDQVDGLDIANEIVKQFGLMGLINLYSLIPMKIFQQIETDVLSVIQMLKTKIILPELEKIGKNESEDLLRLKVFHNMFGYLFIENLCVEFPKQTKDSYLERLVNHFLCENQQHLKPSCNRYRKFERRKMLKNKDYQ